MRRQFLTIILAAGSFVGLLPGEAEACASRLCIPGEVGPRSGQSIPANAALIYVPTVDFLGGSGGADAGLSLTAADGTAVPFTTSLQTPEGRDVVITPTSLEPGTDYVLRYAETCGGGEERAQVEAAQVEVSFTTSPATSLPESVGTLSVEVARASDFPVGTVSGSCMAHVDAMVATLTVSPSEALRPFLPVTRWRVEVDGRALEHQRLGRHHLGGAPRGAVRKLDPVARPGLGLQGVHQRGSRGVRPRGLGRSAPRQGDHRDRRTGATRRVRDRRGPRMSCGSPRRRNAGPDGRRNAGRDGWRKPGRDGRGRR